MTRGKRWAARILASTGVVIVVGEVVRNWFWQHEIEGWVVAIGAALGFFGFYLMAPARAKDAYGFALDGFVKIVDTVRIGRRATDPVVAVTQVVPAPVDPPAVHPTTPEEAP